MFQSLPMALETIVPVHLQVLLLPPPHLHPPHPLPPPPLLHPKAITITTLVLITVKVLETTMLMADLEPIFISMIQSMRLLRITTMLKQ
jgi:hypothetical protein